MRLGFSRLRFQDSMPTQQGGRCKLCSSVPTTVETVFNHFGRIDTSRDSPLNVRLKCNGLPQAIFGICLATRLMRMVDINMAQKHTFARPLRTPREPLAELQQSVPSQLDAVSRFVARLMRFIATFRGAEGSEADIEVALREAIVNAVIHGNGEDPHKRVYVNCRGSIDGELSIAVRDEGQGFNSRAVPDPTTPENRFLPHGRGIYLMRALMDEVTFEEGGTVVCMRKKPNRR